MSTSIESFFDDPKRVEQLLTSAIWHMLPTPYECKDAGIAVPPTLVTAGNPTSGFSAAVLQADKVIYEAGGARRLVDALASLLATIQTNPGRCQQREPTAYVVDDTTRSVPPVPIPNTIASHHDQPGRRFATGSTRGDHLLGFFGFFAHGFFFTAVGAGISHFHPDAAYSVFVATAITAGVLFVIRGKQVGLTTTKESFKALWKAWITG